MREFVLLRFAPRAFRFASGFPVSGFRTRALIIEPERVRVVYVGVEKAWLNICIGVKVMIKLITFHGLHDSDCMEREYAKL